MKAFMHYPKASKKFIGFITKHNRHGNCHFGDKGRGEGTSHVQLCKGLKLIDILHLRTLIQMDSRCSCSPGPSYAPKSESDAFCFQVKPSTCSFPQRNTINGRTCTVTFFCFLLQFQCI